MPTRSEPARLIKVFMASPGDVRDEREALAALIGEVNDVLAFLAPKRMLKLELVRYETHTYPDVGRAQDVINRQIPQDYDVFIGVMWKRCGTPTATAQSGTIEEFTRALSRREKTGKPTIMFYFCDEPFPPPRGEDLEQYTRVNKFREELESKGYTLTYPDRKGFREYVRSGLLRAVADIANIDSDDSVIATEVGAVADTELLSLAQQYDEIRSSMSSGEARTKKMSEILASMRIKAASGRSIFSNLKNSGSPGERLAAIGILQQFPDESENQWLSERLHPESETPFVGYASAVALAQAVRSLHSLSGADGVSRKNALKRCLERALELAALNPHDPPRIRVLNTALKELDSKAISAI